MEPNVVANLMQFVLRGSKYEDKDREKLIKLYGGLIKKSMADSKAKVNNA